VIVAIRRTRVRSIKKTKSSRPSRVVEPPPRLSIGVQREIG
jgi:hypothetical protein